MTEEGVPREDENVINALPFDLDLNDRLPSTTQPHIDIQRFRSPEDPASQSFFDSAPPFSRANPLSGLTASHQPDHDFFQSHARPSPSTMPTDGRSRHHNDSPAHDHHQQQQLPQFDIFEWWPKYQSCQRYFINHAQSSGQVLAVAAFINILLPFQRSVNPIMPAPSHPSPASGSVFGSTSLPAQQNASSVSLIPFLRRLVVTGLDLPGVLHGFFGDDWAAGCGPLHEQERRNFLFAAKSGGWASVKREYDLPPFETVPFMRPLQNPVIAEIEAAEKNWSEWLAMEDWMVGPRAPEAFAGAEGAAPGQQHARSAPPTTDGQHQRATGVTAGQSQRS